MATLTEQMASYAEQGFIFLPEVFDPAEIERMRMRLPEILAEDSPRRVLEKDGKTVRSVYGAHLTDRVFEQLTRDPRILGLAQRIVGDDVYVHQFKINCKFGFGGDVWSWHQDYIFWLKEDGVASPDLTTIVVFLDEVNEFNGPLCFIPGSHKQAVVDVPGSDVVPEQYSNCAPWISNLTAEIKYSVPRDVVARLAGKHGIVAPKGPPGSVLLFHPNLIHGSSANISPLDRMMVLVTYNSVRNTPVRTANPRPEFLCARNYAALEPYAV